MKVCRGYNISSIQIMNSAYMHAKETFVAFMYGVTKFLMPYCYNQFIHMS